MFNISHKKLYWCGVVSFAGSILAMLISFFLTYERRNDHPYIDILLILLAFMLIFSFENCSCYCRRLDHRSKTSFFFIATAFLVFYNPISAMVMLFLENNIIKLIWFIGLLLFFVHWIFFCKEKN